MKNRKLLAILLMVFALAGMAKAAEVPGEKSAADLEALEQEAVSLLSEYLLDVVPAGRRYWSVDPFAGVVKDGFIWGRGALDMKGMGIVELMTMLALKREGIPVKGDVIFLGVADEQAGVL